VRVPDLVIRSLVAGIFIAGGADHLQNTEPRIPPVEKAGLPSPELLIKGSGVGMLAGGVLLALGVMPRFAANLVAAMLVPTTVVGHAFWAEEDEGAKQEQMVQFMKNASMLGGLLAAARMTERRRQLNV
jgi:uncharacterized membrane protein YphA (DoxX/SURF4 family)